MENRKHFITFGFFTLALGAAFLAACSRTSSTETRQTAAGPATKAGVTYPVSAGGEKKLSFWLPIQPPAAKHISSYNEHEIFKIIGQNTGVEVNFSHPAVGQEREQLGILIASGDLPDLIQIRGLYNGGSSAGVAEGVFRELTGDIPVHAPDYYREITKSDRNYRLATDSEGKITEFHIIKQSAPAFNRLNYRQDVMDKLGIDIPVTIADYEEDFAKMKTAGLTGFAPPANGKIDLIMWAYGITPGFHIGADGTVKWGEAQPAYKDYLQLMNDWYTKGYISKDFMSNMSDPERRTLFTTNSVSMIINPVDLIKSVSDAAGFAAVPLPYPRLYAGQAIHFQPVSFETLPLPNESMGTVVSRSCKNPEIAIEYLNYFYTQEGADLCNWGVKDLSYTVDTNGKKTFTDYMLRNEKIPLSDVQVLLKIHLCAKLAEPDVVCNPNVVIDAAALEYRTRYSDDRTIDDDQVLPAFQLSMEDSLKRNEIMRDINTYVDEMTLKFITGVNSLSEFDNYLAQLKNMRLNEAIAITARGYEQFMTKPGVK
ncbi:MAG: extracellular solute-binding protein [Treponema sp.]|jgi:putative aldouronate transport system substrate-binding protein|nr:extracellular solute-binding protein [Treponema sp.]